MKNLYIYCAGGFGKEVMDCAIRQNETFNTWEKISFIDDVAVDKERYGAKIYKIEDLLNAGSPLTIEIIIANGEPKARNLILSKVKKYALKLGQVIDPSVVLAKTAQLLPGVVVTPFGSISSDTKISENVVINTMSIIGHDVEIGENSVISSMVNIGGACKIGKNTYIGMGSLIKEKIKIGDNVIIGMGSVVYADIPDGVIALGNPARIARKNDDGKVFK